MKFRYSQCDPDCILGVTFSFCFSTTSYGGLNVRYAQNVGRQSLGSQLVVLFREDLETLVGEPRLEPVFGLPCPWPFSVSLFSVSVCQELSSSLLQHAPAAMIYPQAYGAN